MTKVVPMDDQLVRMLSISVYYVVLHTDHF